MKTVKTESKLGKNFQPWRFLCTKEEDRQKRGGAALWRNDGNKEEGEGTTKQR